MIINVQKKMSTFAFRCKFFIMRIPNKLEGIIKKIM